MVSEETLIISVTSINEGSDLPDVFALYQNYPNPFNPATNISFSLPEQGFVTLKVFNSLGQQVAILVNSELETGSHMISFDASNLPSGTYFYTLQASEKILSKKMILIK